MTLFYSGRHRAVSTSPGTRRVGLGVTAVAALGIGAPMMVTGTASAAPSTVGSPSSKSTFTAPSSKSTFTAPASRSTFSGIVKYGHRGSIVRTIQRKVGASADGVFGPATRSAVKRYQSRHGLTADGVVGPRTGAKMRLSGSSSRSSSAPSRSTKRSSVNSTSGVLGTAASYVGNRYVLGGARPSGFDCSGYTQYVMAKHGKSLPRTAEAQRRSTSRVSSPRPGDLVFFGSPSYHVGIYAGGGQMYDAGNTRVNVSKRGIWSSSVTYGRV